MQSIGFTNPFSMLRQRNHKLAYIFIYLYLVGEEFLDINIEDFKNFMEDITKLDTSKRIHRVNVVPPFEIDSIAEGAMFRIFRFLSRFTGNIQDLLDSLMILRFPFLDPS